MLYLDPERMLSWWWDAYYGLSETPPMKKQSTETVAESRPVWESLEAFARQGVQDLLQRVLEEEVEPLLGRRRYERREGVAEEDVHARGRLRPAPDHDSGKERARL